MASLSRILYRSFCTSLSTAKPTSPPTMKSIIDDLFKERNLDTLVEKFKKNSESYRFRCKHRIYEVTIRRLASAKRFSSIEEIIEDQKKYEKEMANEGYAIRLINLYGKSGMFEHASKTFDQLPEFKCDRTVKSFNALLNACVDSKNHDKVEEMFRDFLSKKSFKPDIYSYNIVIRAFCENGSFDSASSMLDEMEQNGVKPNVITFNMLLNGLYKNGKFSEGEKIWCRMEKSGIVPDVRSFNAKLRGLIDQKKIDEAVKLVEELKTGGLVKPDVFSYNALMKGHCEAGNLEEAKKIYGDLTKNDFSPNRQTFDILLLHLCEKEEFDLAHKICNDSMSRKYFVKLDLLHKVVDGLVKQSKVEESEKLMELAKLNCGKASLNMPTDDAE